MSEPFRVRRGSRAGSSLAQRGQAVVVLAVAITVLLGAAGLTVDGGMTFVHRRQLQNAADAGALDGTSILARHFNAVCAWEATARQNAIDAALANGVNQPSQVTVGLTDINGTATPVCSGALTKGVSVQVRQSYATYFARLLGVDLSNVSADGVARFGFINQMIGAMPIVLNLDSLPANPNDGLAHPAILSPAGSTGIGPVNFGTIDPTPYGQTLAGALAAGLQIPVTAGRGCGTPPVACKAGSITQIDPAVKAAIQSRIDSAPLETWNSHAPNSQRVVALLVINGDIGNATVLPINFALVFLDSVQGPPQNALYVHFIYESIQPGGALIDPSITNPSPGTPTLIQLIR
jgi:hypothetical protein